MLKPIKKKRLFEEIILAIDKYVQEENIQSGEKLPSESELASIFNVSKTTVREAMSVLHANGIIESRPGMGIFLKKNNGGGIVEKVVANLLKKDELLEILEFRRGLEVEAVSLAAIRATEEDLNAIQQAHQNLVQANQEGSVGVEEDFSFHYSIILASHNSIYKDVFNIVSDKFEDGIRVSKMQSINVPGRFVEGYKEHETIIEALFLKDPELASAAMRHHLVRNEKKIWDNY